ncbi:DUF3883 domain-containing protein [Brevibacillus sp. FSL L8-0520]|uniref:DUF3883 domain-containing protein n=1 Tax=Brevibacillus TaxID=55080 RepID=UPI0030CF4D37
MITQVVSHEPRSLTDIEKFCLSNTSFYNIPIKGIVALLEFISAVSHNDNGLFLTKFGQELIDSIIDNTISKRISIALLTKIISEEVYSDFLDLESINFDHIHEAYIIKNNYIPFKYSGIRNLLINLGFFKYSLQVKNILIIDESYNDFLISILKPVREKISLEKLKEMFVLKEKYGKEAEEFVLDYEKKRLYGHLQIDKISRISEIDVNAGYDIISFDSVNSETLDRFIEVKSYSKNMSFYWTKNEIDVSKNKGSSYYLYLVDREKMNQPDFQPYIIANPYDLVFKNNTWKREAQNWIFYPPSQY